MKKYIYGLLFSVTLLPMNNYTYAKDLDFKDVWSEIYKNSEAIKSGQDSIKASNTSYERAKHHFLPTVYIANQVYRTDDAGQNFMGLMGQRAVTSPDFTPNLLNHPEDETYNNLTFGVNMPLYEGGGKEAKVYASKHYAMSSNLDLKSTVNSEYALALEQYGNLVILKKERLALNEMLSNVNKILKDYKIGTKANPLGYSGLLGLKTLVNSLNASINTNKNSQTAALTTLKEMGLDNYTSFSPTLDFDSLLGSYAKLDFEGSSPKIASVYETAKGLKEEIETSKAPTRPYLGAFARHDTFSGDKDTANSYTVGLYMKWDIFSPDTYNLDKETAYKANALKIKALSMEKSERAIRENVKRAIIAGNRNLQFMLNSQKMLKEQSTETYKLFQNGSINVLQVVDVLSRRVDIIGKISNVYFNLLNLHTMYIVNSDFEVKND